MDSALNSLSNQQYGITHFILIFDAGVSSFDNQASPCFYMTSSSCFV